MNIFSYKSQGAAELSSDAEEKSSPCGQGTFWNVGLDSNLNSLGRRAGVRATLWCVLELGTITVSVSRIIDEAYFP